MDAPEGDPMPGPGIAGEPVPLRLPRLQEWTPIYRAFSDPYREQSPRVRVLRSVARHVPEVIIMKLHARWYFAAPLATLTLCAQGTAFAQYTISTLATTNSSVFTITGKGVAVDAAGGVYATGTVPPHMYGCCDVILELTGAVRPVVGGNTTSLDPGCDQPANNIFMTNVSGVAVNSSGTIYYAAQSGGPTLLKVQPPQPLQTPANCLPSTNISETISVATDNAGNAYFGALITNQQGTATLGWAVYEVSAAGLTQLFVKYGAPNCAGGILGKPEGLAVDRSGNLYIADSICNVVWKVSSSGAALARVAGTFTEGYSGDGGDAKLAMLCQPMGVAVDYDGNLFITDSCNHLVREVSASAGTITTIAGTIPTGGNLHAGLSGDNGPALGAMLQNPHGIAVGLDGMIYFGDQVYNFSPDVRVRQLTPPSARMISPAPGSILPATSVTFDWTGTSRATRFQLDITDEAGWTYPSRPTAATTETVSGLPCDGRTLYVQLHTQIGRNWLSPARYTYHACPMTLTVTPSSLPKQGGTLKITATVANIWQGNVTLSVTEATYPAPPCLINCRPTVVGQTPIQAGTQQSVQYLLNIGPTNSNYLRQFVFVATLTTPSGTFSSSVTVIQ
jgi:hypothetical protein